MNKKKSLGTASLDWGPKELASARALLEHVNPENEQLFRTYHPSLACNESVYIATEPSNGNKIWVIGVDATADTHAGGREIHFHPVFQVPEFHMSSQLFFRENPLDRPINPRRFLAPETLNFLRTMFPMAIGVRVLISGFIIVLFKTEKDMKASWDLGRVSEFGGLRLGYDLLADEATSQVTVSGRSITDSPENVKSFAALGLKLRLSQGTLCITIPTHAFVRTRQTQSRAYIRAVDWMARVKTALWRFAPFTIGSKMEAIGTSNEEPNSNSPLGKRVWLAGERQMVCSNFESGLFSANSFAPPPLPLQTWSEDWYNRDLLRSSYISISPFPAWIYP